MKNFFKIFFILLFLNTQSVTARELSQHDLNIMKRRICNQVEYSTVKNVFSSTISDIKYEKYNYYNNQPLSNKVGIDLFLLIESFLLIENSLFNICRDSSYLHTYYFEAYLKDAVEYCNMIDVMPTFAVEYMDESGFCYISKRDLRRLNNKKMLNQNSN